MNKIVLNCLVFLFLQAVVANPAHAEGFAKDTLAIQTAAGRLRFQVEIATTEAEQELGLMHRRRLAEDHGMLFVWDHDRQVAMWMKDTLIPLDMLFIDKAGKIIYIASEATPNSRAVITTPKPVRAVLELAGGVAAKKGITLGDKVIYRQHKP